MFKIHKTFCKILISTNLITWSKMINFSFSDLQNQFKKYKENVLQSTKSTNSNGVQDNETGEVIFFLIFFDLTNLFLGLYFMFKNKASWKLWS